MASYTVHGSSFRAEKPRLLPGTRFAPRVTGRSFDLHPDGDRFASVKASATDANSKRNHITLIFDFFDELRRTAR